MRVFCLGTGRCCSMTFARACQHLSTFTAAHETNTIDTNLHYKYKDNHIESDPRLFWKLPQIIDKYPEALYVHLIRNKHDCVESLSKRKSLDLLSKFTDVFHILDRLQIANRFYTFINEMIEGFCKYKKVNYMQLSVPVSNETWELFLKEIKAQDDFKESFKEWLVKHNKS